MHLQISFQDTNFARYVSVSTTLSLLGDDTPLQTVSQAVSLHPYLNNFPCIHRALAVKQLSCNEHCYFPFRFPSS
ncbi:hypothetical protein CW304_17865 [Bacillus sp. UFRGS-B20]|nr:hypothetical protein CW304_17865 [Bacillus sp. UFRGS-B20]